MSSNTTTVTHPDGTVSKRTSKSRTYTHAVEVMVPNSTEIAFLQDENARHQASIDRYATSYPDVVATCERHIARNNEKIAALNPAGRKYFVLQWSASLKNASAAARKPYWNQDGKTARVVEVDAK